MSEKSDGNGWCAGAAGVALIVWLVLSGLHLHFGELNQDEGWYLYGARQVAEGLQPYRDFAFTQGPVFPAVYAWAQPLVDAWGVMGGRLFTALLGLTAALMGGLLAARLAPRRWAGPAATLAIVLLLCNAYHSYFSLVVKTYSLTALLMMTGVLCLTRARSRHGSAFLWSAGFFLALAAGVRLSAGIWLPVGGIYLLAQRSAHPRGWLYFGVGGIVGLLLAFGPGLYHAPEQMMFWLVHYHTARDPGSAVELWLYKAGFVSRFVQAYFVTVALLVAWLAGRWAVGSRIATGSSRSGVLWVGAGLLTLLHGLAPIPYEDYQVMLMPLVAALIASGVAHFITARVPEGRQHDGMRATVWCVLLLSVAAAFSSPLNQDWFIRARDRIWWRMKEQSDLATLQSAGRWLADRAGPGEMLLTQDTYLAVEAGLRVPPGLELGPFSYYPDWSREQAERMRVLNREMMIELLETSEANWAAFSGYGLSIRSPDVTELSAEEQAELRTILKRRYEYKKTVPHFGQAHTPLEIYERAVPYPHRTEQQPASPGP